VENETLAHQHSHPSARLEALARCLSALTEAQRRIIERRYLIGESSEEIARAEGRTRSAIAVEIHRICHKLREVVQEPIRVGFPN
jgi:DNA-directed RNA polymerase specialized sigma24 family protein